MLLIMPKLSKTEQTILELISNDPLISQAKIAAKLTKSHLHWWHGI